MIFYEDLVQSMYFHAPVKDFLMTETNQKLVQRIDQIFNKSRKICALVCPLENAEFSPTYQKDLKIGQCLHDIS